MALSAVTPRVRAILVYDEISPSPTEDAVFNLEGARQYLYAASLPWRVSLSVFLLFSSARKGQYPGKLLILNEASERVVRYSKFVASFQEDNELLSLPVDLGDCVFPKIGRYTLQVHFFSRDGEVMKGEQPFFILQHEE